MTPVADALLKTALALVGLMAMFFVYLLAPLALPVTVGVAAVAYGPVRKRILDARDPS